MKKIIICDDEQGIVDMLEMVLCESGFDVHCFDKPKDAVIEAKKGVDVLITDVRMGGMDGTELARLVRMMQPSCKIIMMSGCMGSTERARFSAEGAFACVEKPFNLVDVEHLVLEAAFENHETTTRQK